jgi:hypothetical protein
MKDPVINRGKPTVCLNMIVKDEAHIIKNCLEDISKFIDYYVIIDTGSSDDTIVIIKKVFDSKRIPGEIIEHDFKICTCHGSSYKKSKFFNFAHNRNYALQKCKGKGDYIFVMDADDCIDGTFNLPKLEADQYYLKVRTDNNIYYKPLLFRNDSKLQWKWVAGLHECLDGIPKTTIRLWGNYSVHSRRLGNRNKDPLKYIKDIEFLEELISETPPEDTSLMLRYTYYNAQSHFDAKDYSTAIQIYEKVMQLDDDKDRHYTCLYMIGLSHVLKGSNTEDIEKAFLRCYLKNTNRAEPIFQLASHYNALENYKKAYDYGIKAVDLTVPIDTIFYIDQTVYDYRLLDELVYAATHLGKYNEALLWSEKLLHEKKYPLESHENVVYNIEYLNSLLKNASIKDQTNLNDFIDKQKANLCFYVGPSPLYINEQKFGSEIALEYLAYELSSIYNIFIASDSCYCDNVKGLIFHINSRNITNYITLYKLFYRV